MKKPTATENSDLSNVMTDSKPDDSSTFLTAGLDSSDFSKFDPRESIRIQKVRNAKNEINL
jgi:hypothetical protein